MCRCDRPGWVGVRDVSLRSPIWVSMGIKWTEKNIPGRENSLEA